MRRVSFETYQCDGCWWAKLVEHGHPVPEGHPPNITRAMIWSGETERQAIDKAKTFVRNAQLALESALTSESGQA